MKDNQIKFRVWDVEREEYLETTTYSKGWFFYQNKTKPEINQLSGAAGYVNITYFLENNNYIVEQYLKVKDKNGTELYEGDFYKEDSTGTCHLATLHKHPAPGDNFLIVGNYNIDGFDL